MCNVPDCDTWEVSLPNLARLTMYAAGLPIWQLAEILETSTRLQYLAVYSDHQDEHGPDAEVYPLRLDEPNLAPSLRHLHTVYLAGHIQSLLDVTEAFPKLPNLRFVTLDPNCGSYETYHLSEIIRSLGKCKKLEGLAVFRAPAVDFVAKAMKKRQRGCLDRVKHLVLDDTADAGFLLMDEVGSLCVFGFIEALLTCPGIQ